LALNLTPSEKPTEVKDMIHSGMMNDVLEPVLQLSLMELNLASTVLLIELCLSDPVFSDEINKKIFSPDKLTHEEFPLTNNC
jgi:hypothetical protein